MLRIVNTVIYIFLSHMFIFTFIFFIAHATVWFIYIDKIYDETLASEYKFRYRRNMSRRFERSMVKRVIITDTVRR